MKNCSYCGRENPDDANFCLECGTKFVTGESPTPDDSRSASLVTISTAFNPADAHLTRSRLEAAGFHAIVTNELAALSMDGYSMAIGGIRVQVPDAEAAEAKEFLESATDVPE